MKSYIFIFVIVITANKLFAQQQQGEELITGDVYLEESYKGCQNKDVLSCAKYRALNYLHKVALGHMSTARGFSYNLPFNLVKLQRSPLDNEEVFELFDAAPRSSDSDGMQLYRFGLRELERFSRNYAISLPVPETKQGLTPTIVSEEDIQSGRALEDESRGKKKKLQLLLPLLVLFKFFKLKVLLIPILLGVLAIKKILILAAIFLPSVLSVLKFCKQQPYYHEYSAAPYDYGLTAYGTSSASSYGKDVYSRRNYGDAQTLAYRSQQPAAVAQ